MQDDTVMQDDTATHEALTLANRRHVLAGVGLGMAAATLPRTMTQARAAECGGNYWVKRYTAMKGAEVKLALYRKRKTAPVAGQAASPVLLLAHGSSISGLPSWDLHVPGAGEYSVMNVFAGFGYDVWVIDFEGYGRSTVTDGNSDIKSGVADLAAAMPLIAAETGAEKCMMMGESSGAIRAAAFAAAHPERVERLVLGAYTHTGKGSRTLADRGKQVEFYRSHNRRPRPKEIESIFTRDRPGTSDPRVAAALARAELPFGDSVPTGTYLDMTANLPLVDPKQVKCPVLMAHGQYDGIATEEDLLAFFGQLPTADRQVAILPGLAHSLTLGLNRQIFWHMAHAFLTMPKVRTV